MSQLLRKPSDNCCCALFSEAATVAVLKKFANFTCQSLLLIKLQALEPATLKKKLQHRCFPAKILRTPILNNICERLLLYFHYNPHHHYHYHHFHYPCKMHFYRLRILLTIPLDLNMIPWLLWHMFFSSLILSFLFFMNSKRTQKSLTTTRQILEVIIILIFISIFIYTSLFTLTYLYLCSLYAII